MSSNGKEIWDTLGIIDEGTNQVKESNINILFHKYELIKMNETEIIS